MRIPTPGLSVATVGRDEASHMRSMFWAALVVGCFVLIHPYRGITHDQVLYMAQAMLRLEPAVYGGDPFFKFGSQDQFTLFSPIYAWLIATAGLRWANVILLLLSQVCYLLGSWTLVRRLVPEGLRGWAMVFIACSNGLYGGFFLLHMAEPFVTPRPFVEAITLYAMALAVTGHRYWPPVLITASAVLHPLMALAGLLYWWIYQILGDRRWLYLLVGVPLPFLAGLAGLDPFPRLLQTFDEEWMRALITSNPNIFPGFWRLEDWGLVAVDLAVLLAAALLREGVVRRVALAAVASAAVSVLIGLIGVDWLKNAMIGSLQIWRVLWLVHWIAAALLPVVVLYQWRSGGAGRLLAGVLLFSMVMRGLPSGFVGASVAVLLLYGGGGLRVREPLIRAALVALACGAFVNWVSIALWVQVAADANTLTTFVLEALCKRFPLLVGAAALVFFGLHRGHARAAVALACIVLAVSLATWDRRSAEERYIEEAGRATHPFSRIVREDQQVYWHGEARGPWLLMGRRSYISAAQRGGQMFNRATAVEFIKRQEATDPIEVQEGICKIMRQLEGADPCEIDPDALRNTCLAATELDFIVLESKVGSLPIAIWSPPAEAESSKTYYLYDCQRYRRHS